MSADWDPACSCARGPCRAHGRPDTLALSRRAVRRRVRAGRSGGGGGGNVVGAAVAAVWDFLVDLVTGELLR